MRTANVKTRQGVPIMFVYAAILELHTLDGEIFAVAYLNKLVFK